MTSCPCHYPGCEAESVLHLQYANGPYETVNVCAAHEAWGETEKTRREREAERWRNGRELES